MLENAHEKFVTPLEAFRKDQIGSVKKTKKDFEVRFAKWSLFLTQSRETQCRNISFTEP